MHYLCPEQKAQGLGESLVVDVGETVGLVEAVPASFGISAASNISATKAQYWLAPYIGGSSIVVLTTWAILFVMTGLGLAVGGRYLAAARKVTAELAGGTEYRQPVDDHRRLTDMAITAHEHADLKLAEISVRIDHLTEQMASLRKILEEVE